MKLKVLFKNKNGYAFPMVLMIVTIISLLGVSILGLAMANLKLQNADTKDKQAFYLAEAGLDETYVIMQNKLNDIINDSKSYAQSRVNGMIDAELNQDPDSDHYHDFTDEQWIINEDKVKSRLKEFFKAKYKSDVNNTLEGYLSGMYRDEKYEGTTKELTLDFEQVGSYDLTNLTDKQEEQNFYKLSTVSNYKNKEVNTVFKIKVPDYGLTYVKSDIKPVNDNILWQRPITAEGKIYTTCNNLTINGNIFAYGGVDISSGRVDISSGSNTTINGSLYSSGDIEKKSSATESTLLISNGNVYCSTLRLSNQANSGGNQANSYGNNNVTINGNAFTKDDIELNGYKSNVTIDGSYYGFSDGSSRTPTNNKSFTREDYADKSSCIIVNADDIGNGSSLTITGKEYADNDALNMERIGLTHGVIVAGTAYVNPNDKDNMFQTGESVSIKGNYRAYLQPLWGLGEIGGNNYNASNIWFDIFGDLQLANRFRTFKSPLGVTNSEPHLMLPFERSNYFQQVDNTYNTVIKKNGIQLNNILHTAGAWIGKEDAAGQPEIGYTPDDDYVSDYRDAARDFKYYTNKLGDPNPKYVNYRSFTDPQLDSRVYIRNGDGKEGRFDFSSGYTENSYVSGDITYVTGSKAPLALIGPDGNENNLPEGSTIKHISSDVKGIVITGGSVYIRGRVNYTGILVSEGDLHFDDTNTKNIYYSRWYLLKKIAGIKALNDCFKNNNVRPVSVNLDSYVNYSDTSSKVAISNLITVNDWNQTR